MGVESKIYFVYKYSFDGSIKGKRATEIIAYIDMAKMGYSDSVMKFYGAFNRDSDASLYISGSDDDGNEKMMDVIEDKYGAPLREGDIDELCDLMKKIRKEDNYYRFDILYKMLKAFRKVKDDCNIAVILYQY